jgi:hypothetical protein
MSKHISDLGNFEVRRDKGYDGVCLEIVHVPTGLRCGGFSHIAVKTFKAALQGVNAMEEEMDAENLTALKLIPDSLRRHHAVDAQNRYIELMQKHFPNGAWSRR